MTERILPEMDEEFRWGETPVLWVGGGLDGQFMSPTAPIIECFWGNYKMQETPDGLCMVCMTPKDECPPYCPDPPLLHDTYAMTRPRRR